MDFAVLGCSLDALDAEEKVAMKLAYIHAMREGVLGEGVSRDPYGLLAGPLTELAGVTAAGRLEIEPWLTPRPATPDLDSVDPRLYREFIDTGGCAAISARLREFVKERVLPLRPLLVGVDHSLTGGVLEAVRSAGVEPGLVVLDSHLDAISAGVRKAASEQAAGVRAVPGGEPPESYNCGTWLAAVIGGGLVDPRRVAVIGASDHPGGRAMEGEPAGVGAYREAYLAIEEMGVNVMPKRRLREEGAGRVASEAISRMEGRPVYVSVDADVGAGVEVKAVRFLDTIGLTFLEVLELARALGTAITEAGLEIAGMDVMEVDVHLADIPGSGDRTIEMCEAIVKEVVDAERRVR